MIKSLYSIPIKSVYTMANKAYRPFRCIVYNIYKNFHDLINMRHDE